MLARAGGDVLMLVDESGRRLWLAADPARAEAIRRSGAHSLIVVPLALRGAALGVVSFYRHEAEGPFGDEEVALASDVRARGAVHRQRGTSSPSRRPVR